MVRALEFAGRLRGRGESGEGRIHLKTAISRFTYVHRRKTVVGGFAQRGGVGEGEMGHIKVVFDFAAPAGRKRHGRAHDVGPAWIFKFWHFGQRSNCANGGMRRI